MLEQGLGVPLCGCDCLLPVVAAQKHAATLFDNSQNPFEVFDMGLEVNISFPGVCVSRCNLNQVRGQFDVRHRLRAAADGKELIPRQHWSDGSYHRTVPDLFLVLSELEVGFRLIRPRIEKHRMFARYSHSDFTGQFDKYIPDSTVRGRERKRPHRGLALDNVFVLSPGTVLDVRYGFTWFSEVESFDNQGWDITEFFSKDLVKQLDPEGISFPDIRSKGMLTLGNGGGYTRTYYTHSLLNTLTWIKGDHSLKFGGDLRLMMENNKSFGNVSPRMDFNDAYTRGPLDNSPGAPVGQGIASMLFGLPDGGSTNVND